MTLAPVLNVEMAFLEEKQNFEKVSLIYSG